jgi:transposase-like protein
MAPRSSRKTKQQTAKQQTTAPEPPSATSPAATPATPPCPRRRRRPSPKYSARQKAQAVLTVWTEAQSVTNVCRELSISYTLLSKWQEDALLGMLNALEPKRPVDSDGANLNSRLQKLLEKAAPQPQTPPEPSLLSDRLQRRLSAVQDKHNAAG